jgi:hypothetical protein
MVRQAHHELKMDEQSVRKLNAYDHPLESVAIR